MLLHFDSKENTLKKVDTYHRCEYCGMGNTTFLFVNNKYFHFWFIPIFQYSKKVYLRCSNCDNLRNFKEMPLNFKFEAKELLGKTKTPIVHFAGSFMIIFIIVSLIIKFHNNTEEDITFLNNPKIGDVYQYKLAHSNYTLLKVLKVTEDSVFVCENNYVVDRATGLSKIDLEEFYSKETYGIRKKNLTLLYDEGLILDVDRKVINLQTELFKRLPSLPL